MNKKEYTLSFFINKKTNEVNPKWKPWKFWVKPVIQKETWFRVILTEEFENDTDAYDKFYFFIKLYLKSNLKHNVKMVQIESGIPTSTYIKTTNGIVRVEKSRTNLFLNSSKFGDFP
jgi:hypothetical protein